MIFVAVGSNIIGLKGEIPLELCQKATGLIDGLPGTRVLKVSLWYRSAPFPPTLDQPDYVNGVVGLETTLSPDALLRALNRIEAESGRVRTYRNAPRPLDLDLIAYHDLCRDPDAPDTPAGHDANRIADLAVPHPHLHERAFVLLPLRDVAPGWRHPRTGVSVEDMIGALPPQDISPLP